MRLYDNTQVSGHRSCRRRFFFRHVLGWTGTGSSPPLGFGTCWHRAMDTVWAKAKDSTDPVELAQEAFQTFCDEWVAIGFPDPTDYDPAVWESFKQRTPDTAAEMLINYIKANSSFIRNLDEIIGIEQPFIVPLFEYGTDVMYCGRFDKLIRWKGKVWVVDHKTTSSYSVKMGFQENFTESFDPDSQIEGYAYAAHMLYPGEFKGVLIDGALVWKTRHDVFGLIPIEHKLEHLDAWLVEAREEVKFIEREKQVLKDLPPVEEQPNYLTVFTKNSGACWDWNKPCAYMDTCRAWGNPFKAYATPDGMIVDHWSPFEETHLAKLGILEDEVEEL